MKDNSDKWKRATYLRFSLVGGLLLVAGILCLGFYNSKPAGFVLLGLSFMLNLTAVLKGRKSSGN